MAVSKYTDQELIRMKGQADRYRKALEKNAKYVKDNYTNFPVRFNVQSDADILEALNDSSQGATAYLRRLIRADIARRSAT